MKPISLISAVEAAGVRYVLMDIDDTITTRGKLSSEAFTALWRLHEAGLRVVPITGRPAGWCDLIAREWPADGVVGENGAFAFWEENGILRQEFHPNAVRNDHHALRRIRERALAEVPGVRVAKDQFSRLFDLALDFAEEEPVLTLDAAKQIQAIAIQEGAMAKISSIHVNIWMGKYDKLSMSELFLQKYCGWKKSEAIGTAASVPPLNEIIFVGDSPNDEPMFAHFPLACAVANIRRYVELLKDPPAFVSREECGGGFAEIAQTLLEKRKRG